MIRGENQDTWSRASNEGGVSFGLETVWRAFISYRRQSPRDRWLAHLLQSKLERYRTPRRLVKAGARERVGKVFLDEEELWSGLGLNESLEEAIHNSDFLIVICSPDAAPRPKSEGPDYIQEEIALFRSKPDHRGRLLPVMSSGGMGLLKGMNIHRSDDETLAVDLSGWQRWRPLQDRFEFLGLVAPLVGCSYAQLRDRERRRARLREFAVGLAALIFLVVASVAVWGWREAITQRNVARARLEDVLRVGRLVFGVADQDLKRVHGAGEVRKKLTTTAGEIVEALATQDEQASDPTVLRVRSLGYASSGDDAWAEGEVDVATREYEAALRLDEELLQLDPEGTERYTDLAVSHGKLAKVAMFSGDLKGLEEHVREGKYYAEEAVRRDPGDGFRIHLLAAAYGDLATSAVLVSDWSAARRHLGEEMRLATQAARIEPDEPQIVSTVGATYVKLAKLEVEAGDTDVAWQYAREAVDCFERMRKRFEEDPQVLRGFYVSLFLLGQVSAGLGRPEEAINYLAQARVLAEDQLAKQPRDLETRSWLGLIELGIFDFEMQSGQTSAAKRSIERACGLVVGSKDLRVRTLQEICARSQDTPMSR